MTTEQKSIGDKISVRRAAANTDATAGGSGDDTAVTGAIIDRAAVGWPTSCVLAVPFTATLGEGDTLSVDWTLQTGNDDGLADAGTHASGASDVATGGAGGSTEDGTLEANVNLEGAGRYVRLTFTPDLSAANTDTAALAAVIAFGGADRLPQ